MRLDTIPMPTEELFFLDAGRARMCAVEALLISRARAKISVYDAFYGLTSFHLSAWIEGHVEKTDGKFAASMLSHLRWCEKKRLVLQTPENDPDSIIKNEVLPIGQVVYEVMKGRTKGHAIEIVQQTFTGTQSGKSHEERMALPEATRHLSERTIQRRWAQFEDVLHYVGLYTFNQVRLVANEPLIPMCQGKTFFDEMTSAFQRHKTTRQIVVKDPTFLDFVSEEKFSKLFSEFPPPGWH